MSTFFFLLSLFFDNSAPYVRACVCVRAENTHTHTKQCTKGQASVQSVRPSVRSFASLFLTVIAVYCRPNSSFFVYIYFSSMTSVGYQKPPILNFFQIYLCLSVCVCVYVLFFFIAWWALSQLDMHVLDCTNRSFGLLRRALWFAWLCYLVYVDFASSWLDLTLILIESTLSLFFFVPIVSHNLLRLGEIMVEVGYMTIPHRVLHLAWTIMFTVDHSQFVCVQISCLFERRLYSRLTWFRKRNKSPGITLFLWYVHDSSNGWISSSRKLKYFHRVGRLHSRLLRMSTSHRVYTLPFSGSYLPLSRTIFVLRIIVEQCFSCVQLLFFVSFSLTFFK